MKTKKILAAISAKDVKSLITQCDINNVTNEKLL